MKRTPGRPPLDDDDPSVTVTVRMPSKDFDEVCKRAQRERVNVRELIRRDIRDASKKTLK